MERLDDCVERLEKVVLRFEALQGSAASGVRADMGGVTGQSVGDSVAAADSVNCFKQIIDVQVLKALQVANSINSEGLILPESFRNEIVAVTGVVQKAFQAELKVVEAMSQCKHPHPAELQKLVEPLVEHLQDAANRTEGKRTDAYNHQKTVAEFLQALTWVAQTAEAGKPSMHVDQCWQSAEFYGNKILKEFRTRDPKHVEWIEALKAIAMELKGYLTKYHLKEPKWNPTGMTVSELLGQEPPPEAPPVVTPKKEIHPHPPMKATTHWQPDQHKPEPLQEAFAEQKKGLKKVEPTPPSTDAPPKASFQQVQLKSTQASGRRPRMELEMERKWCVEFFKGNREIVIDQTTAKQTVYIFQCEDSVIQVKGKINAITIDACKKVGVVFDDVVSMVELINCSRTDAQCTGHVSTIVVDKSDECKIYLPEASMDVGITTAKSSSINITVTKADPNEDPVEHAIPYQFVSTFKDGKLVTETVEHVGTA